MTNEFSQIYSAKPLERGVFMKVLRTSIVLIAILLALSIFSTTQAQVEEHQIFLPIITNNYRFRSETIYVREETVQLFSDKAVLEPRKPFWMGIVHNDSSQTKKLVQVEVLYYNSANQLIGHETSSIGGIIAPDGERCFVIGIDSQVSTGFTKASFRVVSFGDEDFQKYRSLSVDNFSKIEIAENNNFPNDKIFQYQGTIHNGYPETLYQTFVTITGFDNLGRVAECVEVPFSYDGFYPDQYFYFTLQGYAVPETISRTIIDVSGSVRSY